MIKHSYRARFNTSRVICGRAGKRDVELHSRREAAAAAAASAASATTTWSIMSTVCPSLMTLGRIALRK